LKLEKEARAIQLPVNSVSSRTMASYQRTK
jgi:hypothetical protein